MVFTERYGSPHTRIIDLISAWNIPFGQVGPQDKICIFTDSAMDPLVWESALAALKLRGVQATLCMFPRLAHHNADPPSMAIGAAKEADVLVALTTTALNSGTPGLRQIRAEGGGTGRTPIWLMEEMTVEILTEGGGSVTQEEFEQVTEAAAAGWRDLRQRQVDPGPVELRLRPGRSDRRLRAGLPCQPLGQAALPA